MRLLRFTLCAALVSALSPLRGPAGVARGAQPVDELVARVQAVLVSDDDGGRPARTTPDQFARWVEFANRVYASARVRFEFCPERGDWSTLRSTLLNDTMGAGAPTWERVKELGNRAAVEHPDRLTVLLRHGPGERGTGMGFSWTDYDFVVMPGFDDDTHCGHAHTDALAHELGHYLGLAHTFAGNPFPGAEAAIRHLRDAGGDPAAFDGDGLPDTPPDPGIADTECTRETEVTLAGIRFPLPRRNIMSYYDERDSLSPLQAERVRWVLAARLRGHGALPRHARLSGALECETLDPRSAGGAAGVQSMAPFGLGRWSGDAQLFCDLPLGGTVTLRLSLPSARTCDLGLYATLAPDFGRVSVSLDARPLAAELDFYAPIVLPSGLLPLGRVRLEAGEHLLTFRVLGKHERSSGFRLGLDALALTATPAPEDGRTDR